jgi:queuine tRNA-ribosyltransferase
VSRFRFTIAAKDGAARAGVIETPHGEIKTPAFMPVGTAATVKGMMPESVKAAGAEIVLANTYHLMLRPGAERIAKLGGLHTFMNWPGPLLTDSGGYQVMSLSKLRKISEEGVAFQSHLDGAKWMLTPERAIEIQMFLGADIVMVLDECTPYPASHAEAKKSMELSMRWAARSKKAFQKHKACARKAALFGIVQGGVYPDLRAESARILKGIGFDGTAIGGLAVGEGQKEMFRVLEATVPHLPEDKPRYLMGVGKPSDLIGAVKRGVDMFDCVLPTRSGRMGEGFTSAGELNLRNARFRDDKKPLDPKCGCPACRDYSRAYLHHLVRSGEMLGAMLLTWHNLHFYQALMQSLRRDIGAGTRPRATPRAASAPNPAPGSRRSRKSSTRP